MKMGSGFSENEPLCVLHLQMQNFVGNQLLYLLLWISCTKLWRNLKAQITFSQTEESRVSFTTGTVTCNCDLNELNYKIHERR